MAKHQCVECKYSIVKPSRFCACNNKLKSADKAVPMKYHQDGSSYCDGFKQIHKGD